MCHIIWSSFAPYGYLKDPKNKNHLVVDEDIVAITKDILRWVVSDGMSLAGAAKRLNELGIPNPTAYKRSLGWQYHNPHAKSNDGLWTGSTVRNILLDQVNLGHMVQGKQRVVSYKVHDRVAMPEDKWFIKHNTHEPTFSQEEYDALARILQRDTRTPNGAREVHLFSGFLRCRDCNKALQRANAKGHAYYCCRTYREKSKTKCTKHSIRDDVLEAAVLAAVQAQISLLDSVADIVDELDRSTATEMQTKRIEKLLREKQKELERAQLLVTGLYVDWKSGEISQEDYRFMKSKFDADTVRITEAIANLEQALRHLNQEVTSENVVFAQLLKHKNVQQLDRALLVKLVDTVYVHENKEITIVFHFADELKKAPPERGVIKSLLPL